jgi:hypothetical protein
LDVAALRRHLSLADHGGAGNTGASQSAHHPLRAPIIKIMVDQFNARLQQLASDAAYGGRVIYVNCRGAVGNKAKWFDEIHPKTPGFGRVANRFKSAISAAFGVA